MITSSNNIATAGLVRYLVLSNPVPTFEYVELSNVLAFLLEKGLIDY